MSEMADLYGVVHTDTWCVLSAVIEDSLTRVLRGEPVEPATIATLINSRRREGEAIGEPEPRDVTPSLGLRLAAVNESAP